MTDSHSIDGYSMVDNESDDLVEVFPCNRACVSSGEPSLDGSVDEERGALSDTDIAHAARTQTIATQVKGPSSDILENTCRMEHEAKDRGDEWEDFLGSGEIFKKTLRRGVGHEKPRDGQYITVKIIDTLRGVDSHERFTFVTGFSMVIDAWELCLKLMTEGEICKLRTSARFAYGAEGLDDIVGPNQQMEYTVELIEIGSSPRYLEMSDEELFDFIIKLKARGNFFFSRKEYEKAIFVYKRALGLVDTPEENESLQKLFSALNSNLSVCYLKVDEWGAVESHANTAISLHPYNTKAYFHRALAYANRGAIDDALDDLRQALRIEPNEKSVQREIDRLIALRQNVRVKEKQIYKKMFSGISEEKATTHRGAFAFLMESRFNLAILTFFIVMLGLFLHFLMQLSN